MLWFKPKTKPVGLVDLFEINDRVLLDFQGSGCHTVIQDVCVDRISVTAPRNREGELLLDRGDSVTIAVPNAEGLKTFSSTVVGYTGKRVSMLILCDVKESGSRDRRQLARIKERIVMQCRRVGADGSKGLWLQAVTKDISAGGLKFLVEHSDPIRPGDELELEIPLQGRSPICTAARVLGVLNYGHGSHDVSEVRAAFNIGSDGDSRKVVKYIDNCLSIFGQERRSSERLTLSTSIPASAMLPAYPKMQEKKCTIRDLSLGGMMISTASPKGIAIGEKMKFRFTLDQMVVNVSCQVVGMTEYPSSVHGTLSMDVKFTDLLEPGHKCIRDFWSKYGMR